MKGMKRSLLYWGGVMEKFFLIMLFTVAGMGILMEILERGSALEMVSVYIPMIGIIAVLALTSTNLSYNLPQSISFGATRKESLIGIEVFTHAIVVQMILIMALCGKYVPNPTQFETSELFRVYGVLFLFTCGAANAIYATTIRFGKTAGMWIYMIYLMIIVVITIGIIASAFMGNMTFWLIEFSGWGAFVSIIFDVIMIGWCSKAIQKFEVRV